MYIYIYIHIPIYIYIYICMHIFAYSYVYTYRQHLLGEALRVLGDGLAPVSDAGRPGQAGPLRSCGNHLSSTTCLAHVFFKSGAIMQQIQLAVSDE